MNYRFKHIIFLRVVTDAAGDAAVTTGKGAAKGFAALDNALGEGRADLALAGGINKQDAKAGLGVMWAMTGVGVIAEGAVAAGAIAVANGLDDALSNTKGESGLQQMTGNPAAKAAIGVGKLGASLYTGGNAVREIGKALTSPFATGGLLLDAISVPSAVTETVQYISNDNIKK
jgi:hypothetical protein